MSKKILIWNTFPLLERAGGPSTYLYHLREYFRSDDQLEVTFLRDRDEVAVASSGPAKKSFIPKRLRDFVRVNQNLSRGLHGYNQPTAGLQSSDLSVYDLIHFHSTVELYQAIPLLENYQGKVVLTSHTPVAPHLENLGDALPLRLIRAKTRKGYAEMDRKAFERADLLIFPAEEAMEPYFNTWPEFKNIIKGKQILYIPTGVPEASGKLTAEVIRQNLNIPADANVICYAGRHNSVKGYDLLKQFGQKILDANPDCYFVILGKESPMEGLKHDRWIEVGWTSDPASYIKASSVFVLPNRQTYFDLILLEVLSLGKRCMLSDAGGNKFFKNLEGRGFDFFKAGNVQSMVETFENMDFTRDFEEELLNAYQSEYTSAAFGKRYANAYLGIA